MPDCLKVSSGALGLQALLQRAQRLDEFAFVRFRQLDDQVDCFVTTPFGVVASRRVGGTVSRDGACAGVSETLALLAGAPDLGASQDASWPGALPPVSGFVLIDILPVHVVRDLAEQGRALARQFSGPLGPPKSLLEQVVITVMSESGQQAEVFMRAVFACTSLGLIPGAQAPADIPRQLRVSVVGRWVRIDAPFGTVYHQAGGFNILDRLV